MPLSFPQRHSSLGDFLHHARPVRIRVGAFTGHEVADSGIDRAAVGSVNRTPVGCTGKGLILYRHTIVRVGVIKTSENAIRRSRYRPQCITGWAIRHSRSPSRAGARTRIRIRAGVNRGTVAVSRGTRLIESTKAVARGLESTGISRGLINRDGVASGSLFVCQVLPGIQGFRDVDVATWRVGSCLQERGHVKLWSIKRTERRCLIDPRGSGPECRWKVRGRR